jgi:hypothetical protein
MMIQAIALRFGYVESNALSWLVFQAEFENDLDLQSKKQAFHSLANFLYQKFMDNRGIKPSKTCCQKSLKADSENEYCSKCGERVRSFGFNYFDWIDFLDGVLHGCIDSFGYCDGADNPNGWDPSLYCFGVPEEDMIIVHENGAEMLSFAVAELHPELKEVIDNEINDCFVDDYQNLLEENNEQPI